MMCRAGDAVTERHDAARRLLATVEQGTFGLCPALRKVFTPVPTGPEWDRLLDRLDRQEGRQ